MFELAISTLLAPLLVALVLAHLTGARRKYGHRAERLYDLANKMPEGPLQERYLAAAEKEAEKVANRTLSLPFGVRMASHFLGFTVVLGIILAFFALRGAELGFALGTSYAAFREGFYSNAEAPQPSWVVDLSFAAYCLFLVGILWSLLNLFWYYVVERLHDRFRQWWKRRNRGGTPIAMAAPGVATGSSTSDPGAPPATGP